MVKGQRALPRLSLSSLLTGKLGGRDERINGGSIVGSESDLPFMAYISRAGVVNNLPMICGGSVRETDGSSSSLFCKLEPYLVK